MANKATKAPKAAAKPKSEEATTAGGSQPQVELPRGTGTQNDVPPPSNPPPIPRGKGPEEKDEATEDTLRLQKDKARWGYGESADTATLLEEQRAIDAGQKAD